MRPLHFGLSVPDADASASWYGRVFGFETISDEIAPPLNARIVFLRGNGFELELFQYLGADKKPLPPERREPNEDIKTCGAKHLAWAVSDMDAEYARLRALNADVALPPFSMGADKVCFLRDNSGILIELIEKPKNGKEPNE